MAGLHGQGRLLARAPRGMSIPGVGCVGAARGARARGGGCLLLLLPSPVSLLGRDTAKSPEEQSLETPRPPAGAQCPQAKAKKPVGYTRQAGAGDRS